MYEYNTTMLELGRATPCCLWTGSDYGIFVDLYCRLAYPTPYDTIIIQQCYCTAAAAAVQATETDEGGETERGRKDPDP